MPVDKERCVRDDGGGLLADRRNMAYSGTMVTAGRGTRSLVIATGARTELGHIARLVEARRANSARRCKTAWRASAVDWR